MSILGFEPQYYSGTNSASDSTVYYDDMKFSTPSLYLPTASLPTSRSSSTLGSDYGLNPKYRTKKPPWARSDLELFRRRGERYSTKRGQEDGDKENSGGEDKVMVPATSTLVRPDGRRVSVCTPSKQWIVHWHEMLRRKSLEQLESQEMASPDSPILHVSPPTPSPASSATNLNTDGFAWDRFDSDLSNTVFDLVRRKDGGRGSLPHNTERLTPPSGHSREDSTSSMESISALVMVVQERQALEKLTGTDAVDNAHVERPSETDAHTRKDYVDERRDVAERNSCDSEKKITSIEKGNLHVCDSRTPSPVSSRGSRPHSPAWSHSSVSPCPSPSPSRRSHNRSDKSRSPLDKPQFTYPRFDPALNPQSERKLRQQLEKLQHCPCGGLHEDKLSPALDCSPYTDLVNHDLWPPAREHLLPHNGSPSTPRRDTSSMPPTPLPQIQIESPKRNPKFMWSLPSPVTSASAPQQARTRRTGASVFRLPVTQLRKKDRHGRRLLPAPAAAVEAAKARASASASDDSHDNDDRKENSRREKVKLLPSTRSASLGQPELPAAQQTSYPHGQTAKAAPGKGKAYSSSSPGFSSDDDCNQSQPEKTRALSQDATREGGAMGGVRGGVGLNRKDSGSGSSSLVSYTAESVRSNSSATNVDPSSDDSFSNHSMHDELQRQQKHKQQQQPQLQLEPTNTDPVNPHSPHLPSKKQGHLHESHPHTAPSAPTDNPPTGPSLPAKSKASALASKLRFGRKTKDVAKSSNANENQKKNKSGGAEGKKVEVGKSGDLSAKRSDNFEEVYNSNVERLLETMTGLPAPRSSKAGKIRLKDLKLKPGPTGKNSPFLLQQSLSLSDELADNAGFFDSEEWVEFELDEGSRGQENETALTVDCSADEDVVNECVRVEELLSPSQRELGQRQQLSLEEGEPCRASVSTPETEEGTATPVSERRLEREAGTKAKNITEMSCTSPEPDYEEWRKTAPQVKPYVQQHAALISRTPDWEIPESVKARLSRADSSASDSLSVIQETPESGQDELPSGSDDNDHRGAESDDTLYGYNSEDDFSDDGGHHRQLRDQNQEPETEVANKTLGLGLEVNDQNQILQVETESNIRQEESPTLETENNIIQEESPIMETENNIIQEESPTLETENNIKQEESPIMETENNIIQEESPIMETENNIIQEESPTLETENNIIQEESPIMETENNIIQEESPIMETENNIIEEESPILVTENNIIQEESPTLETENNIIQEESLTLETENNLQKKSSTFETNNNNIIQEQSSTFENNNNIRQNKSLTLETEKEFVANDIKVYNYTYSQENVVENVVVSEDKNADREDEIDDLSRCSSSVSADDSYPVCYALEETAASSRPSPAISADMESRGEQGRTDTTGDSDIDTSHSIRCFDEPIGEREETLADGNEPQAALSECLVSKDGDLDQAESDEVMIAAAEIDDSRLGSFDHKDVKEVVENSQDDGIVSDAGTCVGGSEFETSNPPLASSCTAEVNDGDGDDNDDKGNETHDDVDDSSSSHTSAGSRGQKTTLLSMAMEVEKENRLLEREREERAKEQEHREKLDQQDDQDDAAAQRMSSREPDTDSLTSGHMSESSGGFFSRLKTRARRKGYPPAQTSSNFSLVNKPNPNKKKKK
ncbi:zonadhesin [Plakobranchus ocellatus]|uniref:Zonadhesin n=1 Tax=Plakobranchus ocellatus TaxID=259542 RepID=A0AAV4AZP6_9GAST|nr:zonadhesin [Plakobranchus ocellatus]